MKVLIIAPPVLKDQNDIQSYTTVPPDGYGGVENLIYALINGLIYHKCHITLIGAPGSRFMNNLDVIRNARKPAEIRAWVFKNYSKFDIVHDHSLGLVFNREQNIEGMPYIASYHKTGISPYPRNTVYVSLAQRKQANDDNAPVIRVPVIMGDYLFQTKKENYFLYIGRVSEWKGVYEAAGFCNKLGAKLIIAGPKWESHYFQRIQNDYPKNINYVGNVQGLKKIDLLAHAKAVFVLSRFINGPWGQLWCESGATVVSEAGASGTPVISSTNGCLAEIVTPEIGFQLNEQEIASYDVSKFQHVFPKPQSIRNYVSRKWNHLLISKQYISLYRKMLGK